MKYIDLRSDTVTMPTDAMRKAMAEAAVGDDVYGDDPTMKELEELAADILGKEAALFVPSGTMGNQLAIMTHTRRGDEIIAGSEAHIVWHEVGAPAVLSGVSVLQQVFPDGMPDAKMIERAIRGSDIHEPETSLICLENALSNGRVVSTAIMKEVSEVAKRHNLPVHLDGARVFNAAMALGVDVKEITKHVDTVSCCLSKGLCAPVGTVLLGSRAFIARARKLRKLLGGGMRQCGILAAAGIIALTEMPNRLIEDHDNAKYMAKLLSQIDGVHVDMDSVEINMVWFDADRPADALSNVQSIMLKDNIKINGPDGTRFRFVTNNDVSRADVEEAVKSFRRAIG